MSAAKQPCLGYVGIVERARVLQPPLVDGPGFQ